MAAGEMMSGQIFISYRREESGWVAGRLRDRLLRVFDWQGHHCFDEREAACRVSVAHRALGALASGSLAENGAERSNRWPRLRSFSWVEKRSTRLPFSAFDRSFKCMGGFTIRQDHKAIGKVFVNVPANKSIHLMAA